MSSGEIEAEIEEIARLFAHGGGSARGFLRFGEGGERRCGLGRVDLRGGGEGR